jgi:alcohol dehydrogenase (NADP+)
MPNLLLPILFATLSLTQQIIPSALPPNANLLTEIPSMGFGTWYLKGTNGTESVASAIEKGYRYIDCAYHYYNQEEIGLGIKEGLKRTGLKRNDLWITSKLWNTRFVVPLSEKKRVKSRKLK